DEASPKIVFARAMLGRESVADHAGATKRLRDVRGISAGRIAFRAAALWHQSLLLKPAALHYLAANPTEEPHEKPDRQARRRLVCPDARRAWSDGAEQDHHRGRRRRLPLLSADGAGKAAWRVREGGPQCRARRSQGRFGRAEGRARRQRRCGL